MGTIDPRFNYSKTINQDDKLDYKKLANQVRRLNVHHKIAIKKRQQRLLMKDLKKIKHVDPNMIIEEEEEEKKVDANKHIEFYKLEPETRKRKLKAELAELAKNR